MKAAVTAPCRLCGNIGLLRESHIMPAWSHRNASERPGSVRAKVNLEGEVARLSDYQHKERMLCSDCEQRFSKREGYVSGVVSQPDGSFPASRAARWVESRQTYDRSMARRDASSMDCEAIAYFGASVLWRSVVAQKHAFNMDVSSGEERELREYLLGRAGFPPSLQLAVELLEEEDSTLPIHRVVIFPYAAVRARQGGAAEVTIHCCLVMGLLFVFFSGGPAASKFRQFSLLQDRRMLVNAFREPFTDKFVEALLGAQVKGRLATWPNAG